MNRTDRRCSALLPAALLGPALSGFVALAATGCASRAAPFDKLDQAQVTIMKLQAPPTAQPAPTQGPIPGLPGLPAELQTLGQQALDALKQQGIPVPDLIPGQQTQAQPQMPMFRNQWAIADQRPVVDEDLRDELLDLFGDEDNFNDSRGNCFFPGMAVSFSSPEFPEPVDVVISLSCNQAVGYGFQWPHPNSGFTSQTHSKLTDVYQNHFGPVPPGA